MLLVMALSSVSREQATTPASQVRGSLDLMPWPSTVASQPGSGRMPIDPNFSVVLEAHADARLQKAVRIFLADLRRHTGMGALAFSNANAPRPAQPALIIRSDHPGNQVQALGEDESYSLRVSESGAELSAPNPLGVMRGLQTFLQLVGTTSQGFAAPAVTIHDQPRFPWRGLMLDSSRHFLPLEVIKRNLDGMAAVKLNVFHWHLSDNQGFRAESKRFPKLQELGSDGHYYTQDQLRHIVSYARDRGIRVVAEFDIPGHTLSWLVAYPELAS